MIGKIEAGSCTVHRQTMSPSGLFGERCQVCVGSIGNGTRPAFGKPGVTT